MSVSPDAFPEDAVPPEFTEGAMGQASFEDAKSCLSRKVASRFWQWVVLVVIAVWGGKLMLSGIAGNAAGESWLHLVNLPFHEAGHIFFRPLGSFVTSLGGTLGQLLVPLVCMTVLLLKTRDPFGAAVCLWWFGENFLDIAPYINDARAGQLPLVGGNFGHSSPYGFHDWEYLLTEAGLLRYDHVLAKIAHGFGSLLMILAIVWAAGVLSKEPGSGKTTLAQTYRGSK